MGLETRLLAQVAPTARKTLGLENRWRCRPAANVDWLIPCVPTNPHELYRGHAFPRATPTDPQSPDSQDRRPRPDTGIRPRPPDRTGHTQVSHCPGVSLGLLQSRQHSKPKVGTCVSSTMSRSWKPREDWGCSWWRENRDRASGHTMWF